MEGNANMFMCISEDKGEIIFLPIQAHRHTKHISMDSLGISGYQVKNPYSSSFLIFQNLTEPSFLLNNLGNIPPGGISCHSSVSQGPPQPLQPDT